MATINGTNGNDDLNGTGNSDDIFGEAGDDILRGNGGADTLEGGTGADDLQGGAGFDTASYKLAASGVIADLLFLGNNTGEAAGDTYNSIEKLTGSDFNDSLGGDHGNNVIVGGAGNDFIGGRGGSDELFGEEGDDWLSGDGGADRLEGGFGIDLADYFSAASAVNLDLDTGGTLGDANGDTYGGIENVQGSNFNDGLRGDALTNSLFGLDGDDVLTARVATTIFSVTTATTGCSAAPGPTGCSAEQALT
jgi:Ca2+-binding RTX toxin-like protein